MIRSSQLLSLIVAGAALAGAGVWLVSRHGGSSAQETAGQVLPLPPADLNAVSRLRIFKGDGSHTTLTRTATRWLVAERGYPADTGQVRKLLLDLSALQIEEQKTADPALYSKLDVETPSSVQTTSLGVDIDLNGKTLGLIVGKTSGTSSVYVRVAGQAQSLLATPQLAPDADPRHWLDRTLLDIAPDQITEVNLEPQSGPAYTIKRSASGATPDYTVTPLPKGRELSDPSAAAAQAGALAGLQLDDVRKAGSLKAVAHARFLTADGLTLALAGIQDGELRYITVTASGAAAAQQRAQDLNAKLAGWEFEVPGYHYDTLFRPLEQLLKPRPTATAAQSQSPKPGSPHPVAPLQSH
jgi:hypothetical protein